MALLEKLKSLLGFDDSQSRSDRQRDVGVTVEREPEKSTIERETPDAGTERTVKGAGRTPPASASTTDTEPTDESAEVTDSGEAEATSGTAKETEPEAAADVIDDAEPGTSVEPEPEPEPEPATESGEPEPTEPAPADTGDGSEPEPVEPAVDDASLVSLKGIGPAYAERLEEAGITTIDDLANADPEATGEAIGVSPKRVGRWIDRAKSH